VLKNFYLLLILELMKANDESGGQGFIRIWGKITVLLSKQGLLSNILNFETGRLDREGRKDGGLCAFCLFGLGIFDTVM
jgi:hypothetical protein